MKYFCTILFCLGALWGRGQTVQYLGGPTTQIYVRGQLRVDTVIYLPVRDTNFIPSQIGALVVKGTQPYVWIGTKWQAVSIGAPIWGQIAGTLSNQTDLQTALNGKQATMSAGYGIKLATNSILFDSANVRKVDTIYRINDSTLRFTINSIPYNVLLRGTAAGGISSLVLTVPTSLFNSPVTFNNSGGAWTGSLTMPNQSANTFFGGPSGGSPAAPTFRLLTIADLPLNIPNSNLANSTIAYGIGTSGTVPNWSLATVSLGGTTTLNIPLTSGSNTGLVTPGLYTTWNNKIDNTLTSAHLLVGNGSNIAADVPLTGDASLTNAGVLTNTGLRGAVLPSLSTGNLRYNSGWTFDNTTYTSAANNGLTDSANYVQLGGSLTHYTTINLAQSNRSLWIKTLLKTTSDSNRTTQLWVGDDTAHLPHSNKKSEFNSAIVIGKTQENNNENVNLLFMTTTDASAGFNGIAFRNYTDAAGHVQPQMLTLSPSQTDISHGWEHYVSMRDGTDLTPDNTAYVINVNNYDSTVSGGDSHNFPVKRTAMYVFENGPTHVFLIDSAYHFKLGTDGDLTLKARAALQIVKDTALYGIMQLGDASTNYYRGQTIFDSSVTVSTANASAQVQINSTTRGFLLPRMTNTQKNAISSPAEGLQVYDDSTHQISTYNGSRWTTNLAGSFSTTGSGGATYTVGLGTVLPSATYAVTITPTAALTATNFYVTNKTTSTFDVTFTSGLTGTVTFDWALRQ